MLRRELLSLTKPTLSLDCKWPVPHYQSLSTKIQVLTSLKTKTINGTSSQKSSYLIMMPNICQREKKSKDSCLRKTKNSLTRQCSWFIMKSQKSKRTNSKDGCVPSLDSSLVLHFQAQPFCWFSLVVTLSTVAQVLMQICICISEKETLTTWLLVSWWWSLMSTTQRTPVSFPSISCTKTQVGTMSNLKQQSEAPAQPLPTSTH